VHGGEDAESYNTDSQLAHRSVPNTVHSTRTAIIVRQSECPHRTSLVRFLEMFYRTPKRWQARQKERDTLADYVSPDSK